MLNCMTNDSRHSHDNSNASRAVVDEKQLDPFRKKGEKIGISSSSLKHRENDIQCSLKF